MRIQDQVVKQTQRALGDLIRAVDALPADKVDWAPAEVARSAFNQLQEVALSPNFFLKIIKEGESPEFKDHAKSEADRIRKSITDLEGCKAAAMEQTAVLCSAISAFPDERLDDEVTLPFGGGTVMSMADILGLHAWNMVYHLGQVNYIQLMLGDKEMH